MYVCMYVCVCVSWVCGGWDLLFISSHTVSLSHSMYVCICMHTYIYIYICIHTYIYIYTYILYAYIYAYIHTHAYIHILLHTHAYLHILLHTHAYIHILAGIRGRLHFEIIYITVEQLPENSRGRHHFEIMQGSFGLFLVIKQAFLLVRGHRAHCTPAFDPRISVCWHPRAQPPTNLIHTFVCLYILCTYVRMYVCMYDVYVYGLGFRRGGWVRVCLCSEMNYCVCMCRYLYFYINIYLSI